VFVDDHREEPDLHVDVDRLARLKRLALVEGVPRAVRLEQVGLAALAQAYLDFFAGS